MFKIGIIGTENSHAGAFIDIFKNDPAYSDIKVVCVGGKYEDANKKLQEKYGVEIINEPEKMAGRIDAAMITCRDGKYHAGYAEKFINAGIPVFVDKPFTVDGDQALNLMKLAKEKGVPIVGGSSLKSSYDVLFLENRVNLNKKDVRAGTIVAPVSMNNEYSGFYFYSAHLAETCLRIFGYDPIAVNARLCNNNVVAMVEYADYTVNLQFVSDCDCYFGQVITSNGIYERNIDLSFIYRHECEEFADMLRNGKMKYSYEQLVKSVFLLNAIEQSYTSGKRVEIRKI